MQISSSSLPRRDAGCFVCRWSGRTVARLFCKHTQPLLRCTTLLLQRLAPCYPSGCTENATTAAYAAASCLRNWLHNASSSLWWNLHFPNFKSEFHFIFATVSRGSVIPHPFSSDGGIDASLARMVDHHLVSYFVFSFSIYFVFGLKHSS